MILSGLLKKIKWIIVLVVIITIIYWIVRLWRWKPLLKEMLAREVGLAEAMSRFNNDNPTKQKDKASNSDRSSTETKSEDDDFSYLERRFKDFMSRPPRRPVRTAKSDPPTDANEKEDETEEVEVEEKNEPKGRDPVRRSNSKVSTYKREEICRQVFEDYFDDYFPTCRPRFLANPKTGHPLELDGYNPRLNLAFEHHGIQHRQYPNPFHKSEAEFDAQIGRDQFKRERLAELGIDLIEIWDDVPTDRIKDFIHGQLKSLGK